MMLWAAPGAGSILALAAPVFVGWLMVGRILDGARARAASDA